LLFQEERQRKKEEQQAKEAAAQVHANVLILINNSKLLCDRRIKFNGYVV